MELHGVDIVPLDDSGEVRTMGAGGGCFIRIERSEGVGKIKMRSSVNAREQGQVSLCVDLVPAHVRQFYARRQCRNDSGKKIQSLESRGFLARLEQDLQAETDAQKRNAAVDGINQRCAELFFIEGADQGGVMSDAGEKQRLRFGNFLGRIGAE